MIRGKETLEPTEGVAPGIGYYLAGMEEVRAQLRDAVKDLPDDVAHARLMPETHTIAGLILHCGEAEWWWIQCVVNGRPIDDELKATTFWDVLDDGNEPEGMSATECIAEIDGITAKTRDLLSAFTDSDLDRYFLKERSNGVKIEKSLRWILHHLIDHEAQHKGQILMLKRLLSSSG
ncbi:MAG: DinB family protein [Acidobacteria bacterium]|nr:MAG: DinB family protein [Acidobacteriota bacterium]REK04192.1 MAG: DinB family protein [Acidobacteriota bacterium]REK15354.1 MAG: DinB family protein [Acidobacteriota bacterium]REK46444.1 MAG: DinB family protein [Acidobacteriota bacterium]